MLQDEVITGISYSDDLTTATVQYASGNTEVVSGPEGLAQIGERMKEPLALADLMATLKELSPWLRGYIKNHLSAMDNE